MLIPSFSFSLRIIIFIFFIVVIVVVENDKNFILKLEQKKLWGSCLMKSGKPVS